MRNYEWPEGWPEGYPDGYCDDLGGTYEEYIAGRTVLDADERLLLGLIAKGLAVRCRVCGFSTPQPRKWPDTDVCSVGCQRKGTTTTTTRAKKGAR